MEENQVADEVWQPSLLDRLVSVLFWTFNGLLFIPISLTLMTLYKVFGADRVDFISRLWVRYQLLAVGLRVKFHVDPAIDSKTPYVFMQNHVNHLDVIACYCATPHFKQGIELAKHFKWPFYGWFMEARGTIGVVKGSSESVKQGMIEELDRGHSILVFPEGHRTLNGRTKRFKRGIFHITGELGTPIVPVCVVGSFNFMRKGSLVMRPFRTIHVHMMAPIATKGLSTDELENLRDEVRGIIDEKLNAV